MAALRPLVILGAGGHASDILGVVEAINIDAPTWQVLGVHDDRPPGASWRFDGRAAYGGPVAEAFSRDAWFVAAVGYPVGRHQMATRAEEAGLHAATLIHPRASLATAVTVGEGAAVLAMSHLSPLVATGRHVLVSHGAIIGHDTVIGDGTSVLPGANLSGDCTVGSQVLIGTGASVLQGLSIGDAAVVGAGAVVVSDVAPGTTVTGVPGVAR